MDGKNRYSRYTRGSFTVEASAVMGMALLVICMILFLAAFVHGRAYLTAAACEQAVTERRQETPGLFGVSGIHMEMNMAGEENRVTYQAGCRAVWGGYQKSFEAAAAFKKLKPVRHILRISAVKEGLSYGD